MKRILLAIVALTIVTFACNLNTAEFEAKLKPTDRVLVTSPVTVIINDVQVRDISSGLEMSMEEFKSLPCSVKDDLVERGNLQIIKSGVSNE